MHETGWTFSFSFSCCQQGYQCQAVADSKEGEPPSNIAISNSKNITVVGCAHMHCVQTLPLPWFVNSSLCVISNWAVCVCACVGGGILCLVAASAGRQLHVQPPRGGICPRCRRYAPAQSAHNLWRLTVVKCNSKKAPINQKFSLA